jgi:hypothetical protein
MSTAPKLRDSSPVLCSEMFSFHDVDVCGYLIQPDSDLQRPPNIQQTQIRDPRNI